jgi:hypothetical protein
VSETGAFDIVAELWPHLTMIIYRLCPGRHVLMYRLFVSTSVAEVVGTIFETTVILWLWGTLWSQWTLPFRVVTPILHALFSAAQLFGAWVFWKLAKKERAIIKAAETEPSPRIEGISDGIPIESLTEKSLPDPNEALAPVNSRPREMEVG